MASDGLDRADRRLSAADGGVAVLAGDLQARLTGQLDFLGGRGGHVGQRVAFELFRVAMRPMSLIDLAPRKASRKPSETRFSERNSRSLVTSMVQREHRGQQQADHDDLNDRVGVHEHGADVQLAARS